MAVVAGVAMVWFALTSAAAKQSMKKAVLSLDGKAAVKAD